MLRFNRLLILCLLLPLNSEAQHQFISNRNFHLRFGSLQEWSTFPVESKDSILTIQFDATDTTARTLALTQHDVNHDWKVIMNGRLLGNLVVDENRMVSYYPVPSGLLKKNDNTLQVVPDPHAGPNSDDIYIGKIILYNSGLNDLLGEGSLNIYPEPKAKDLPGPKTKNLHKQPSYVQVSVVSKAARDGNSQQPIPSRLTILNSDNALQPLSAVPGDTMAVRTGVIYSATGNYSFSLPHGKYKIYASRGFEYGVDSADITITSNGKINKKLVLKHEVPLQGWSSIDPHVHTREYSGHGDATMKERVITIAGEGLDYAVITEHNRAVNIQDTVEQMGMGKWFTPITGDELTTRVGHFNIFPIRDSVPSPHVDNWTSLTENIKTVDPEIVILNHARDIHNGFRPTDTIFKIKKTDFPANAMEVINSGSQQTDPRQLYMDWMRLMSRGIVLTPVGSSDSHDVTRFIVGQARTYVRKDSSLTESFLAGRVGVSFGLFTELTVEGDSTGRQNISRKIERSRKLPVTVKVYCPSWIKPVNVSLFANGKKIFADVLTMQKGKHVIVKRIFISKPANKTILVAVAEGPDPKVPWWPIAKPYQHTSPKVNPLVLGISGPVVIR